MFVLKATVRTEHDGCSIDGGGKGTDSAGMKLWQVAGLKPTAYTLGAHDGEGHKRTPPDRYQNKGEGKEEVVQSTGHRQGDRKAGKDEESPQSRWSD